MASRFIRFVRYQSTGSFFQSKLAEQSSKTIYKTNKELRNHPEVSKLLNPAPVPSTSYISPLKRALYEENIKANGKFVNKSKIFYNNQEYELKISKEEQRALEPSVYLQSYRIKGSWKKTFVFLRMFRRMRLFDAINQCHFSSRRMAFDLAAMFEKGKEDAVKLGLKPEDLVIEQIWVGKDGDDRKRIDFKGRGRSGLITSHFVHVKAILKPKQVLEQRDSKFKQRMDRKLWFPLTNFGVKEEFVQTANYKW